LTRRLFVILLSRRQLSLGPESARVLAQRCEGVLGRECLEVPETKTIACRLDPTAAVSNRSSAHDIAIDYARSPPVWAGQLRKGFSIGCPTLSRGGRGQQ
jgi:hypothetical protein